MRAVRPLLIAASLAAVTGLSACETYDGPGYGPRYEPGVPARVEQGVVVGARPVDVGRPNTGTGAVVGGVSGAVVGSELASRGSGFAGSVLGAVGGALIGNAIEGSGSHHRGYAYLIRLDRSGREIEVAQADEYPLRQGVHVAVTFGPRVRVVPNGPPPGDRPRY